MRRVLVRLHQKQKSSTHRNRFYSLDEFLTLQVLQYFINLSQRKVTLETDVSAPDPLQHTNTSFG